jgi:hypothetical protein
MILYQKCNTTLICLWSFLGWKQATGAKYKSTWLTSFAQGWFLDVPVSLLTSSDFSIWNFIKFIIA